LVCRNTNQILNWLRNRFGSFVVVVHSPLSWVTSYLSWPRKISSRGILHSYQFGFFCTIFCLPLLRFGIPNKSLTPRIQWDEKSRSNNWRKDKNKTKVTIILWCSHFIVLIQKSHEINWLLLASYSNAHSTLSLSCNTDLLQTWSAQS
jgi:hypothetical protein